MDTQETVELFALPSACGGEVRGELAYAGRPGPRAVVYVHGFGSHRGGEKAAALRAAALHRGWAFAAFDFRGHGESRFGPPGGPDRKLRDLRAGGLQDDLRAAAAALAARGVGRLGLVGSSMGGFAAAWFALASDSVPAVVLLAPAFQFLERRWARLSAEEREAYRRDGFLRVRNDWLDTEVGYGLVEDREPFHPSALAAAWRKPVLVFHGLADDVVPALDGVAFAATCAGGPVEVRLFKDGDHRLTAHKDEIAAEACRFFEAWW